MSKIGTLNANARRQEMKAHSSDKLILCHLSINSIRNNFGALKFIVDNTIDMFLISEAKLDDSFPTAQFLIRGAVLHTDLIDLIERRRTALVYR